MKVWLAWGEQFDSPGAKIFGVATTEVGAHALVGRAALQDGPSCMPPDIHIREIDVLDLIEKESDDNATE